MTKLSFITSASPDGVSDTSQQRITVVAPDGVSVTSRAWRRKHTVGVVTLKPFPTDEEVPTDPAALRALAWLDRGQPQEEIIYDEDSPKQSPKELGLFRRASLRRSKKA